MATVPPKVYSARLRAVAALTGRFLLEVRVAAGLLLYSVDSNRSFARISSPDMKSQGKPSSRVTTASGIKFHKLNTKRWEWRDAYHWLLTLSWPQFSVCVLALYLCINLLFSFCYYLRPNCIAGAKPDAWADAFFFSVETLATVGYGHMYPETLFGHVVATVEIMTGMFGMAIITGLIFIRFSRPVARIVFSDCLVLSSFNGQPALMLRVANLRDQAMAPPPGSIDAYYLRRHELAAVSRLEKKASVEPGFGTPNRLASSARSPA